MASSQAARDDAALDVVAAWDFPGESFLRGHRSHLAKGEVDRLIKKADLVCRDRLLGLLARSDMNGVPYLTHLQKGPAVDVLDQYILDKDIDLVVMGTVSRTGIPGLIIGNTAETILNSVPCSVMTVKPAEFSSPVELPDV